MFNFTFLPRRRRKGAAPLAIANAMLLELQRTGRSANLIRLQRLVVIAQGWSLAFGDELLYEADTLLHGGTPTVSAIHSAFRRHGMDDIPALAEYPDFPGVEHPADEDPRRLRIISAVVNEYAMFSGYDLGIMLRHHFEGNDANGVLDRKTLREAFLPSEEPALAA